MAPPAEVAFAAMGTEVRLLVVGGRRRSLELARRRVEDLERRWSRFLDESEVSRLNRGAGGPVPVSEETRLLVARAVDGWRLTGGAFDPTVLGAVLRAGYVEPFDRLGPDVVPGRSDLQPGCGGIVVGAGTAALPPGTGFDPGGIGKGLAADLVVADLLAEGAAGACADLGGDVRVAGEGPGGEGWTVSVEHPARSGPLVLLGLVDGAVATSTTLRRRWSAGGVERHHLVDPRTGEPSTSDVELAAVVAGEAWAAEVLATAALVLGGGRPWELLGAVGAEGLLVTSSGHVGTSGGLAAHLGGRPAPRRLLER